MLEQLLNHVNRHQLCKTTDKILLAVSGGVDSMVMLDLLHKAGFYIAVAHCNFQLRGDESDQDEALVKSLCVQKSIAFHSKKFQTKAFAEQNGLSIQLAARKLRYEFFETICSENQYDLIATAHHLNDSIETVILNLARGTGISGVTGIPVKNNLVIRPLLFASRDEILGYAMLNKISWREDKTNTEDDYQRNFVRHKVIPLFEEINPNFEQTFKLSAERLGGAKSLMQKYLANFRLQSVEQKSDGEWIKRADLMNHENPQTLLWELIKNLGFNYDQCCDAIATKQSGKNFITITHRLIVDREYMIVSERDSHEVLEVLIEASQSVATNGIEFLTVQQTTNCKIEFESNPGFAQIDAAKLTFPLKWRPWQHGDSFKPLGMNAHKKLSDFLIDTKTPTSQKQSVTVIESGGKIVWVVGKRISDEFKITTKTTATLLLKVSKTDS